MDDSNPYKLLTERRHPDYAAKLPHWEFVEATYQGGREWFDKNIFRYVKEGEGEFADRLARAYRFNHTREVVDLVDKYLFKIEITRRVDDAPESVKRFWKLATQSGLDMQALARRISNKSSIFGRHWIVVDSNAPPVDKAADRPTKKDEKDGKVKIYAYAVRPQQVLDMGYDNDGVLTWILIHEVARDDANPFTSSGKLIDRYRLWTAQDWSLFEVRKEGRKTVVKLVKQHTHGLGEVPVLPADNSISDEPYTSEGLIDDIAYMDRAVANYLGCLDAIIQDQTFSQLAMPAQGILPGDSAYDKLMEMGTKRIFTFDGEAKQAPFFLSPDPTQASLILEAVSKITTEIYHTVGLAGERTSSDQGTGVDNASGAAKAYDFVRVNSLLASKAAGLCAIENKIARLVALWAGEEDQLKEDTPLVVYPENFDVRGLYDEFEIGARLTLLNAPDGTRREQMKLVIDKLFPMLPKSEKEVLIAELKDWPPEDLLGLGAEGAPNTPNKPAGPVKAAGNQKLAKEMTAG